MASRSPRARAAAPRPAAPVPVRYCAVYNCANNYRTQPHISYFSLPPEEDRLKLWLERIRRTDIKPLKSGRVSGYYRVCEAHFERRWINDNGCRRRLSRRAAPTLRLPRGDSFVTVFNSDRSEPRAYQVCGRALTRSTMEVFQYIDETPKRQRKKRRDTVQSLQKPTFASPVVPPAPLAQFFSDCDQHLNRHMAEFVKIVAQLRQKTDGQSEALNNLCVKLLLAGPAAYRVLRTALGLPSELALRRHCAPLLLDFDTKLADLLKMRVDRMTEKEKHCTVSVDFIDVRPHLFYNITFDRIIGLHEINGIQSPWPATRCAVLSARALLAGWLQPAALGPLARVDRHLDEWVDGAIRRLRALGLKVHALVSSPTHRRPGVSAERPYFLVDEQKVYHVYDPPRLVKLLLCNFVSYDFHFENKVAKWSDIVEYHKMEKHKPLTLTPELTDAHTNPSRLRRMRGRTAARVLSRALAAALACYADRGLLGASARATVTFILKINNLFDILSSTTTNASREYAKGLTRDPEQIGFLTYMSSFFNTLKMKDSFGVDAADRTRLVDGWRTTIAAVLALREDSEPTRPHLLTRRLHLDDESLDALRRSGGAGGKPTCREVCTAFGKLLFNGLLQPAGKEDSGDLNGLLARVSTGDAHSLSGEDPFQVEEEAAVRVSDYRSLRLPRRDALSGAAGHVLRAVRRVHGACPRAAAYVAAGPSGALVRLLRRLDAALAAALGARAAPGARLGDLLLDLHVLECDLPCECFPLTFLKKLFLRMRLYRILRQNQTAFKNCNGEFKFLVKTLE